MDPVKVAQMVEVLNGLTAREALCLLVGFTLTILDEAPSDEERQQSLDNCIDLLKGVSGRFEDQGPLVSHPGHVSAVARIGGPPQRLCVKSNWKQQRARQVRSGVNAQREIVDTWRRAVAAAV